MLGPLGHLLAQDGDVAGHSAGGEDEEIAHRIQVETQISRIASCSDERLAMSPATSGASAAPPTR